MGRRRPCASGAERTLGMRSDALENPVGQTRGATRADKGVLFAHTSRKSVSCGLILWKTTFWMDDLPERRAPISRTRGFPGSGDDMTDEVSAQDTRKERACSASARRLGG